MPIDLRTKGKESSSQLTWIQTEALELIDFEAYYRKHPNRNLEAESPRLSMGYLY